MLTRIREVRKGKGLTLADVAERCRPATTPQTIGRLETGTRTLSLDWLDRIATALAVEARDLVHMPDEEAVGIAAIVGAEGAHAPTRREDLPPLRPEPGALAIRFATSIGDYRGGDMLLCRRVEQVNLPGALNRDILVPRPAGRFLFGRLLALDGERLQLLPLIDGARQQVVALPEWIAVATRLIRTLGA